MISSPEFPEDGEEVEVKQGKYEGKRGFVVNVVDDEALISFDDDNMVWLTIEEIQPAKGDTPDSVDNPMQIQDRVVVDSPGTLRHGHAGYIIGTSSLGWLVQFSDNTNNWFPGHKLIKSLYAEESPVDGPVLDDEDPFENVLLRMVQMNRKKRSDYAQDHVSPFSNFQFTADVMGMSPVDSAVFNVAQKLARLTSLRANGRMNHPENESVADTYLDLAVYATIALAMYTHGSEGDIHHG